MKRFIIFLFFTACLLWGIDAYCQAKVIDGINVSKKPEQILDSIQREAELNRLMDSTMKYINITMDKIKPTTTVTDFEKYYEAYRFFRSMFLQVCRDEWNRKKKK